MPAKSAKSRATKRVDRPFHTDILERATAIAAAYQIVIQFENGEYYGRGLEMPYVMSDGPTPDLCVASTREALVAAVATALEAGQAPPAAASEGKRTEQVNIRVTPEEKVLMESAARSRGYRGVGDFVRTTTLAHLT